MELASSLTCYFASCVSLGKLLSGKFFLISETGMIDR